MLDQNAEEALDRSVQSTMHHHRLLARAVFSHVLQPKALRQIEVKLHGRKLPKPADRIHQFDVNLRPVKSGFARHGFIFNIQTLEYDFERTSRQEIGRASCRERVLYRGVAGALKRKNY